MQKAKVDRSKFNFTTEVRVRLNETDALGIIFHGNYFTYMDVGRVDYLRNLDLMEEGRPIKGFDNVVVHTNCDFHHPARYDDPLVIYVRIAKLGRSSFHFEFLFYSKKTNMILASGSSVHCAVNFEELTPAPLPEFFRKKISEYEGDQLGAWTSSKVSD
jgi:acyl-CoA thioester hydrolase